jgi:hypothetical protein
LEHGSIGAAQGFYNSYCLLLLPLFDPRFEISLIIRQYGVYKSRVAFLIIHPCWLKLSRRLSTHSASRIVRVE